MKTKHMFISDLDGTLLRSDRTFSTRDLDALDRLGRMGVTRVLATGRSVFSLKRSVPGPLPFDYLIFSTGLGVAPYPGSTPHIMKTEGLNADQTLDIARQFKDMALDFMIHDPLPDNHTFVYDGPSGSNPDFMTRIGFYEHHCRPMDNGPLCPGPSSQIIAMVPETSGHGIYLELKRRLTAYTVIRTTSPFDGKTLWIEVFPESVSKASAAFWLADHLGIDRRNIAAVGNDYNDESLLCDVEKAYVVENAPEDLKQRFTVVSSNDRHGVSDAVKDAFGIG